MRFATITDLIAAITPVLGEYAKDYDVEGIARDIMSFDSAGNVMADVERPDLWLIADRHEIGSHYEYFAYVRRMSLIEEDEHYVEEDEDIYRGEHYRNEYFDTEEAAIAYVKREMADYVSRKLDGKGYKVIRAKRGLDPIDYIDGTVERHYISGISGEAIDFGDDPKTEHYYENGYYACSLPDEVREKAMRIQRGYHRFLDYQGDWYGSLADALADC